jgi:hypothetical protein
MAVNKGLPGLWKIAILWRNSPLLDNGLLKACFLETNILVKIKPLPRDWDMFRSNGWIHNNRRTLRGGVLSSVRPELQKRRHSWVVIRQRVPSFGIRKRAQCSAVEPAENGSWRSDWIINQNQVSDSRREDTRSPVMNEASLRQSLIVSCYNWL